MQKNKTLGDYLPFWKNLTAEQKHLLLSSLQERDYGRGNIIHSGQDDCIGLIIVTSGQVRVYIVSDEGKELTLFRLLERDMCLFSASCIIPSLQFEVMVAAETDLSLLIIPAGVFKALMDESAAVANYTNALMASHFSEVMWLMDQILNKKLDTRIAAFLLEESLLTSKPTLKLTHEKIANHLGSIREVITRILRYFQEEGLVKLSRGSITLVDFNRIEALAESSRK
ncbi:MAG: Crp/Fnr family transcriptional regulator [Eubacteriales bacterium]|jgi:CRP/FNR family transcriptional regulator